MCSATWMANVYVKNLWMVTNVLNVNPHTMVFQVAKVCLLNFFNGVYPKHSFVFRVQL